MAEQTTVETIKVEGSQLIDQVKRLIHEGNVRRISILFQLLCAHTRSYAPGWLCGRSASCRASGPG